HAPLRTMMAPQSGQLGASSECATPASCGPVGTGSLETGLTARAAAHARSGDGSVAAWVNFDASCGASATSTPLGGAMLALSGGWASLGRNLRASQRKM